MLYKIAEGHVPAFPPDKTLVKMPKSRRRITPKRFEGFETTNIIAKYAVNNSRGFIIPENEGTEQYRSSFFVKTIIEWNELPESVVQSNTVASFSAAVSREANRAALQ